MRYPVVLFDVGETLVGPRESFGAVYSRVLGELGLPLDRATLQSCLQQVMEETCEQIPAGVDRYAFFPGGEDEYWMRFARRTIELACGRLVDEGFALRSLARLRGAFLEREAWEVFPDVTPVLEALRDAGVRMGVVSNWDSRLPAVLSMLELDGYFETVGVSHIEGIEKPDPALFHRVLERMSAAPGDALHIGDVPEMDLLGARRAGIDSLLIDRRGKLDGSHETIPDLTSIPNRVRPG